MNIYNTNKRTSRLVSKGFVLVSYPSITYPWCNQQRLQRLNKTLNSLRKTALQLNITKIVFTENSITTKYNKNSFHTT